MYDKSEGFFLNLVKSWVMILVLWVPFTLWLPFAALICLVALLLGARAFAKEILRPMDYMMAGSFGWGSTETVSARCGSSKKDCLFCGIICTLLNFVDKNHCSNAAERRGLNDTRTG